MFLLVIALRNSFYLSHNGSKIIIYKQSDDLS